MTKTEIGEVWLALGNTWGNKFYEEYGKQPNRAWSAALGSLDDKRAAQYALRKLIHAGQPYAPTLPEFFKLAKSYAPLPQPATVHELPLTPADHERVRANLAKLRAALSGDDTTFPFDKPEGDT